jgi:hypothetical protein
MPESGALGGLAKGKDTSFLVIFILYRKNRLALQDLLCNTNSTRKGVNNKKEPKMTTKQKKAELLLEYAPRLHTLQPIAQKAFGSRATDSIIHDISNEYTTILTEYAKAGGSLMLLATELGVTYAALRRRVTTSSMTPLGRPTRSKATPEDYDRAKLFILVERPKGTMAYHDAIKTLYEAGLSLNKLAPYLNLKSAYPLYYGLNSARMRAEGKK